MAIVKGWAALGPRQQLQPYTYDSGPLNAEDVEVAVEYCGLCHSDLSMLNNDWGLSQYPIIPGHEVVGRIVAVGEQVKGLKVGQSVGIGWNALSCMYCRECLTGQHHLCRETQPTIVGHHGGFAERVRAHWVWAIPLPDTLDKAVTGPLLCGGITVFAPLQVYDVKPTDRVGIVGIGGLGHLALQFAHAWGCEVIAFTSNATKAGEVHKFGASHSVSSRDSNEISKLANTLDFLLITANIPLDWSLLLKTLKPNGRMHIVGAVLEPMPIQAFDLIMGQKSISGSPTGGPVMTATMLDFAARHRITPQVEHFSLNQVNEAIAHLAAGKAKYRIVLDHEN